MVNYRLHIRHLVLNFYIILFTSMLSACNTSYHQKPIVAMHLSNNSNDFLLHAYKEKFRDIDIKSKIMNQYYAWKGVRYRLGGSTKRGIDCSKFVQLTFREQFKLYLPRSTSGQLKVGFKIQQNKLRPGDLVLFQSGLTGLHIGIYVDDYKFIHASSHGVMISDLKENYWKFRYRTARRALPTK